MFSDNKMENLAFLVVMVLGLVVVLLDLLYWRAG
jgi:hypothetical protein